MKKKKWEKRKKSFSNMHHTILLLCWIMSATRKMWEMMYSSWWSLHKSRIPPSNWLYFMFFLLSTRIKSGISSCCAWHLSASSFIQIKLCSPCSFLSSTIYEMKFIDCEMFILHLFKWNHEMKIFELFPLGKMANGKCLWSLIKTHLNFMLTDNKSMKERAGEMKMMNFLWIYYCDKMQMLSIFVRLENFPVFFFL